MNFGKKEFAFLLSIYTVFFISGCSKDPVVVFAVTYGGIMHDSGLGVYFDSNGTHADPWDSIFTTTINVNYIGADSISFSNGLYHKFLIAKNDSYNYTSGSISSINVSTWILSHDSLIYNYYSANQGGSWHSEKFVGMK